MSSYNFYQQKHHYINQNGGAVTLTDEQHAELVTEFNKITNKDQKDYENIKTGMDGLTKTIYLFDSYEDVFNRVKQMADNQDENISIDNSNNLTEQNTEELLELVDALDNTGLDIDESNNKVQIKPYETIRTGTILYHPSQNVKKFNDAMIFVDINQVLDKTRQRSFSMFFTPNEEYARRYSGLWSLNKRAVYVHKLHVKRNITGVKVFDASIIPDNMDNLDLAKQVCGPSEDGVINGIKIEQAIENNNVVDEYYICNPESYFDFVETWMQFGSTEWIKISKENTQTIQVPEKINNIKNDNEDVKLNHSS